MDDDEFYILGCSLILRSYYNYNIDFRRPYFYDIPFKGEQLSEEDRLLEEGRSPRWSWVNKIEDSTTVTTNYIDELDDQYLLNINLEDNE